MATRFQQLGAFVNNIDAVSEEQLQRFAQIGGRWVVPLLAQLGYSDDHDQSCVNNMALLDHFRERCHGLGIACGGWFVGWAGGELGHTAEQDADQIQRIVKAHDPADNRFGPICLNLELPYQYPSGNTAALPALLWAYKQRIKTRETIVSTNSPNDSMAWNGHGLYPDYRASMRRLNIKLGPQWYNAPAYGHGTWMRPDLTMQWIQAHGMEDNWYDPKYVNKRAIALSQIHGTLEVTGLEEADLNGELMELRDAKRLYGYTTGFSIYVLEKTPPNDFDLIAQHRGFLYLV